MIKFTVNEKTYVLNEELNFKFLVMLDKNDIKVTNMTGLATVNCFLAFVGNMDEDQASEEISQHVIKGGKLDDVYTAYKQALEESGFFRSLMEQAETGQKEVEETDKETPKKTRKVKAEASE